MEIARTIRTLRLANHYTQERLAEKCRVSRQAIAKWEAGANFPDVENIVTLSEIFHVSVDELLTGKKAVEQSDIKETSTIDYVANEKIVNQALKNAISYKDPSEEINQFISFIGKQVGCSRVYIFEASSEGRYRNTYEWCNKGIEPQIEHLQSIPLEDMSVWLEAFSHEGRVFIEDVDAIMLTQPIVYRWLKPQGVESLLAYPIFGGRGFLGVDNPVSAFLGQTSSLMEIMIRFIETMLQRRDMLKELRWATMQDEQLSELYKGVRFQINAATGELHYDPAEVRESGYDFSMKTLAELDEYALKHPEFYDHLMIDGIEKALTLKKNVSVEFISYKSNRQIRWNRLSIRSFLDSKGNVVQLYGMLRDISEEHRIIEQYNRYISHLSGGLHICYLSNPIHLEYVSDDLCAFLGYDRDEFDLLIGSKYSNAIAPEDRATFSAYAEKLSKEPKIESCEYSLIKKDGSLVRVIDTMESVLDCNGIMYGYAHILEKSQYPLLLDMARESEKRQLKLISLQYEVLESLGRDFLNIFRVWLDQDKAQIVQLEGYVTKGMEKGSTDYIPYYRFCQQYVRDRVHPSDKQKMLDAMHPDTVRRAFLNSDDYVVVYRAVEDGETHFYQLKYVKLNNSPDDEGLSFVAGFKNVDAVVHEEHMQNERLKGELSIIQAILRAFTCGYYMNYKKETFVELSCSNKEITKIVGKRGTFAEVAARTKKLFPDKEAYKQIFEFLRKDTLDTRLGARGGLQSQVFIKGFGWFKIYLLVVDYDERGRVAHCVYLARDITEEKRQIGSA